MSAKIFVDFFLKQKGAFDGFYNFFFSLPKIFLDVEEWAQLKLSYIFFKDERSFGLIGYFY